MSIVNDIVQSIKNFKKNKTISEIKSSNKKNIDIKNDINNIENEKDDTIDNKIEQPTTRTVNKNKMQKFIILGIVFIICVIFGATYGKSDAPKNKEVEIATSSDNSLNKEIIGDDYDNIQTKKKLGNYEYNKTHKLQKEDNINNNVENDQDIDSSEKVNRSYERNNNNTTNNNYNRPLPILNSNGTYNPYMNVVSPVPRTQAVPQQSVQQINQNQDKTINENKKDNKNIFESAIAFISDSSSKDNIENIEHTSDASTNSKLMTYIPPTQNSLQAGTYIPLILLNGVNSQTGGQIMAQVQTNIYDSLEGINILVPMGARLIGEYASGAKQGQNRININWKHLVMPDGSTYNIEGAFQTADLNGYPGIPGDVNNHNGEKISAGMFSSALAALGSIATGNNSYGNDYGWHDSGQLAMQGASANLLNTASSIFKQKLEIEPEITVEAGTTFYVYLTQSISF